MRAYLIVCVLTALALAGCGPKKMPPLPKTVAVRGKVLLAGGQPLNGGKLTFHNKDPRRAAVEGEAELDADGAFRPTTFAENDGLLPGTYVVTISPISHKALRPKQVNGSLIPQKYRSEDSTPWEVTVEDGKTDLEPLVVR